jgi:predicted nucleic acid-binding protein
VKALDTSVLVAAFASWHEAHEAALQVLPARPGVIAHCVVEVYSVLTRLPSPHRMPAADVAELLAARAGPALGLPAEAQVALPRTSARLGIAGGAVYDALVAATAAHHGATLVTLDVRATETYRKVGVPFELLPYR